MSSFLVLLGQVDISDLPRNQSGNAGSSLYSNLAMGAGILVAIGIGTIWAVLYSKKKKNRKHRHHRHHESTKREALKFKDHEEGAEPERRGRRHRQRRQRRPHRPMNPTLAQTNGLPPMRDENTPLPPMP